MTAYMVTLACPATIDITVTAADEAEAATKAIEYAKEAKLLDAVIEDEYTVVRIREADRGDS